jgi:hypothetical protein
MSTTEKEIAELDQLVEAQRKDDRIELKLGPNGYQIPPNPAYVAPVASIDKRRRGERMCMKARRLEVVADHLELVSEGSLADTSILVDGQLLTGVTRFELSSNRKDGGLRYRTKSSVAGKDVLAEGSLAAVIVDGVSIGGITHFELVAAKGYNRITAVASMNYDHEKIAEYAENAGKEVRHGDSGSAAVITVDIFKREPV